MTKLTKIAVVVVAVLFAFSPASFAAQQSSAPVNVTAVVPSALTLNVELHQNSSTGAVVTEMNFGTLLDDDNNNTLRSSVNGSTGTGSVVAVLSANTQQAQYTISQTGTALQSAGNSIPNGAYTVVPVYAAADNGGAAIPAGASVGTAGTAVGARTLYSSEASPSQIRVIQAHYSITDDPAAGSTAIVPINQPGGTYTGTVTFTVTTV